jgi:anti-sigma B factor antagonist
VQPSFVDFLRVAAVSEERSSVTWSAGLPVVTPPLEIDIANANELRAEILAASASGRDAVIIDMSETAFCDSTGLNVLVRAHKQLEAEDRELRLVIREPSLLRIFAVTGVDTMFRLFPSLDEAVAQTAPAEAMAQEDQPER